MLTEHTVAEAASAAGVTAPVRFVPVTGSTNTDLWRLAERGAPEWTIVAAGRQEAGRGRLGRSWISLPGASLHVSILLRPTIAPDVSPLLTLAAAVAAAEACRSEGNVPVGCKWPNDLVAGGKKLGGILTEASVEGDRVAFVVIGTGVNVTQRAEDFPGELRDIATSIAREESDATVEAILRGYLTYLRRLYGQGGEGIAERALDPYRALCVTLGRRVRAATSERVAVEGVARAVGDGGELLIETASGRRAVQFGEVVHLE
jgi:BirA family transcriptional regulator, biotin operon repressor / biotin---[acetyl-CoA-carboxylase] ligase